MPVFNYVDSTDYTIHGSTFAAYVNTARGGAQLCAWRLTVPPGTTGVAHRPSREEVLLVIDGTLHITIDGESNQLGPGSGAHVPAGALLRIDSGADGGSAWVTTTPGLTATTQDGSVITPPWAQ
ncbi:MAG TPA: cupin domain-containing protein [Acidothermaceae bacterium]|jgi:quercetin dioxygenase-like cupin family protein